MHTDLVTVLKRCQKGNQATFTLLRQPQEVRNIWSGGGICNCCVVGVIRTLLEGVYRSTYCMESLYCAPFELRTSPL